MSAPRLTEAVKRRIVELYQQGISNKKIADMFGVDASYPRLLARRRGVKPKPKQETQH